MTLMAIKNVNGSVTADTSSFRDFFFPAYVVQEACEGLSGGYTSIGEYIPLA